MKKRLSLLLITAAVATFLTACARSAQTQDTVGVEPQVQTGDAVSEEESTDGSGDAATLPDLTESRPVAYAPCVRVNGVIYQDTGFLSSMVGCGNMDGSCLPKTMKLISEKGMATSSARTTPCLCTGTTNPIFSGMWILRIRRSRRRYCISQPR